MAIILLLLHKDYIALMQICIPPFIDENIELRLKPLLQLFLFQSLKRKNHTDHLLFLSNSLDIVKDDSVSSFKLLIV